jgi:hypothetical protein
LVDGEDLSGFGLVESAGDAFKGGKVTDQADMWFLPADGWSVGAFQVMAGQVFEGVMSPLSRCAEVVFAGWRHQSVQCGE